MYEDTIKNINIEEFYMENGVLNISFLNGNKFEYFSVPKPIYIKMVNAESPNRFARRHVYNNFVYSSASKLEAVEL
jgi:hypothetical protein